MEDIFFWTRHDKHGYCSNFYRASVEIGGKVYPTTEHYFQACKTSDPEEHEMIRNLPTPKEAKFAGYHVKLIIEWEEVKEEFMLIALRAKFTQHPDLKEKLLSTGDAVLHEDSPWDKYWGYAKGRGQDRLGKLLMQVREELRGDRCGAYTEHWEKLGKPKGWPGCSLPKGHEGNHSDKEELRR